LKDASSRIWALFLLCLPVIACGQTGFLKGHVDDVATKQALIGATVLVRGTFLGSATDTAGNFLVKEIPPGRYTVDVSMVGYGSSSFPEVLIVSGRSATLEIHMIARAIESDQVIVTASRREQSSHDVPVSISTVSARTLALRLPTTLDDALRYIPGVNLAYDQVNIR
jgi:outer membrane receptor protein involved in Fe transport